MRKILILFCLVLLFATNAWAFTATPTGTEVVVKYTEPTTNADGSPLVDLAKTKIYWVIVGSTTPAVTIDVTATKATGGGIISQTLILPIAANKEADVQIWATATYKSGNESGPSVKEAVRVDRLPPGEPK